MKIYADFGYYSAEFNGTAIPEGRYPSFAVRAAAELDRLTGRSIGEPSEEVCFAACAVAEELFSQEQGGELQSESVGGQSVSYVQSGKGPDRRLYDAARTYLHGTGLLYAGV